MCIQDSAAIGNFELGYFSYLVFYNAEKLPKGISYKHSIFVDYFIMMNAKAFRK